MINELSLDKNYDPKNISYLHEYIKYAYLEKFSNKGYFIEKERDVVSGEVDQSVIFIGSTISALKSLYVSGSVTSPGNVICQPCIRTHNLITAYNEEQTKGNSFFNLVGGIGRGDCFRDVYGVTLEFLLRMFGDQRSRMYVRVSSEDKDLVQYLQEFNLPIEIDSKPVSSHRWRYGLEGVIGRGISIATKDESEKGYLTLGNIILMESEKYPLMTQWGYGIESIISGYYKKPHVMQGSFSAQAIPFSEEKLKFMDFLSTIVEMFNAGLMPIKQGPGRFMRFYLKALAHQVEKMGISQYEVDKYLADYCELRKVKPLEEISKIVRGSNQTHKKNVERLRTALTNRSLGKRNPYEISNDYQLHPKEVEKLIQEVSL